MSNVGSIKVNFEGDASGLQKTQEQVRASLTKTSASFDEVKRSQERMAASVSSSSAYGGLTTGAARAQERLASLQKTAGDVDNKMGRLQVAIGGVGDAFGVAGSQVKNVVGGLADAAMAFATGGPLLLGAAAVGVAISALASEFEKAEKRAAEFAAARAKQVKDLKDDLKAAADEAQRAADKLESARTGRTVEEIQHSRTRAGKEEQLAQARSRMVMFGGTAEGQKGKDFLTARDAVVDIEKTLSLMAQAAADEASAAALLAKPPKPASAAKASTREELRVTGGADVPGVDSRELAKQDAAERARANALLNDGAVAFDHGTRDFALNMVDGREAAEQTRQILERAHQATLDFAAGVGGMVSAVLSGKGGAAAGADVGATVGGLVGSIFGGAALGEKIGGVIGSIMGNALDELVAAVGVLTPLFDGLAVLISALQPILVVLRQLFADVGELLVALAPIILDLARPIAALLLVAVRIVEVLLPFVDMILAGVSALLQFVDFITLGVGWLDAHFFAPLASGAIALYNAFVDAVNAFTEAINAFLPDELGQFGTRLNHITTNPWDTTTGDFANELSSLIGDSVEDGARDGVAAGLSTGTENLPGWYKIAPAMAASADAGPSRTTVNVTIGQWISRGGLRQDLDELQRVARNGGLGPFVGRRNNPDERN